MTIGQIMKALQGVKSHQYDDETVLGWISELEAAIYNDVHIWHADMAEPEPRTKADMDEPIMVPDAYKNVYLLYLIAQIDFANGELNRYNNSMTMANSAFENWANTFNRQTRVLRPNYIRGAK